jgi:hypothetical protein
LEGPASPSAASPWPLRRRLRVREGGSEGGEDVLVID